MTNATKSSSITLFLSPDTIFPLFHISKAPSNMTKYNEDPWWIFEMHKIEPDLQLITNVAKKKEEKQEKENAENACHKIPMTQSSPLSASLSNTTTKPNHPHHCHPIHLSHQRLSWDLVRKC
jgi:hypothetical protein